jgi:hypothetical protein
VSVSSTFYKQLLCVQIPKAQKDTDDLIVFFALLGSVRVKAAHKLLVKLTMPHFFTLSPHSNSFNILLSFFAPTIIGLILDILSFKAETSLRCSPISEQL